MAFTSRRILKSKRNVVQVETLEQRQLMTIAATATLADASIPLGNNPVQINLSKFFNEPSPGSNMAFFTTSLGVIPVQLTPGATPKTVANFESYVNSGAYNGTIVSASQPNSFFIGGLDTISATDTSGGQIRGLTQGPAVPNEFGASNVRGTIATTLQTTDPNSATYGFVFNESDSNAASFDASKLTVFGHVVGSAGLAVLDAIGSVPVPDPGPDSSLPNLPVENFTGGTSYQFNQLVLISSVTLGSEGFAVSTDNPAVVAIDLTGDTMALTPAAAGTAHVTVTGMGSDGVPVTQTFGVTVTPELTATPVTVTAKGLLPSSIVSGAPAKIHVGATVTATQALTTTATTTLLLTANTSFGVQFPIATVQSSFKLKSGKHANVNLTAKQIPADVPGGTYFVTISVSGAGMQPTVIGTGQMLTVAPPEVNLGGSFKVLKATAKAGQNTSATFIVTNSGNTDVSGMLLLNVTKSTDGSQLEVYDKTAHIKAGKSATIHLAWNAGVSGEQYFVDVEIDPNDNFNSINPSTLSVVSPTTVIVS